MSEDHIAITGLALCAIWVAAAYGRRYFRKPPPVTPLVPEVRPESYAEHADEAIAVTCELDPVAAQWDAIAAEMKAARDAEAVEFAAVVMETIHALPETEASQ